MHLKMQKEKENSYLDKKKMKSEFLAKKNDRWFNPLFLE